jgi:Suppressor of fused protein (SUFU)
MSVPSEPAPGFDFPESGEEYVNAICAHVVKHIGPVTNVYHEVMSDLVHVDLLVVGPREERPYTTLVTCGMSDRPMRVPIENPEDLGLVPELRFAELLLCLPPEWPLTPDDFRDESSYWPLRWLKKLARLPHQHEGWLGLGHTIPNGDPQRPFAPNSAFCGWVVDEPVLFPAELRKLRIKAKAINFYSVVPVYEEEMTLKLQNGSGALGTLFDRAKVSELIDLARPNVALKSPS